MSERPAPFTPMDCILQGYEWMALMGHRLFTSAWYSKAIRDGRGGLAAIKLWWVSMGMVPAGSLPDDEAELAMLADFGTDLRAWRKHRALAMYGWVLCSDGRWYHPVVAEQVLKAFACRRDHERDNAQAKERVRRWRAANSERNPNDVTRNNVTALRVTYAEQPRNVTRTFALDSTRQDRTVQGDRESVSINTNSLSSNCTDGSRAREDLPQPDALEAVLSEAGIEKPAPIEPPPNAYRPPKPAADSVGAGPVKAQVDRVTKAMAMKIPYGEVRSAEAQLDAIKAQPAAVGADETMGLRWQPVETTLTQQQQAEAFLAGCTPEQQLKAQMAFAQRARIG